MAYKVDILINYDSHSRMVKDKDCLLLETKEVDNCSFIYNYRLLNTMSDYQGFVTDKKLKKLIRKQFIEAYGKHMSWESFRILSIRRA